MSDYNPNNFDKYGNPLPSSTNIYDVGESTGRAPYVLLGILVLIGIVGGALYFHGAPGGSSRNANVASAPPAMERSVTPTPVPMPQPSTPSTAPATTPSTPPDTTQK